MDKEYAQCLWCSTFVKEWYFTEGELMNDSCPFKGMCDFQPILDWKSEIGCTEETH